MTGRVGLIRRLLALAVVILTAGIAQAETKVFKYDQFGETIEAAASEVNGLVLATQPGFVQTEAFGQVYRPDSANYPIKILGIDLILAAPPNATSLNTHAQIEIWNSTAGGPDPGTGSPMFSISTTQLFDLAAGEFGIPLQGGVGMKIDFDYGDAAGHPDLITSGNIWVMIRFTSAAKDMEAEWGTLQCSTFGGLACGCQNVGTINDFSTTSQANVLHIVTPVGVCSGTLAWVYADTGAGVTGDFLIRMRADVAGTACVPNCGSNVCGEDGCQGNCGLCSGGDVCSSGQCVPPGCLPDCANKTCGDDGCNNGGTCGTCTGTQTCTNGNCTGPGACNPPCVAGQTCDNGTCVGCTPSCAGNCGDDGCGGSCGVCTGGQTCSGTVCAGGTPGDLAILEISPTSGDNADYVNVAITGTGFVQGIDVLIGGQSLAGIKVTGPGLIQAQVPPNLTVGPQTVIVANTDGKTASLTNGYTVTATTGPTCGDLLCEVQKGETAVTCPADCAPVSSGTSGGCRCETGEGIPLGPIEFVLALLTLVFLRRRSLHEQG